VQSGKSAACDLQLSPAGLEPTTYGLKVPVLSDHCSTFEKAHESADLQQVVAAWPRLSPSLRAAIVQLIESL
jgi:hypothetical protein